MWTYDPNDLTAPLNKVRLLVGDTNENDQQLQDEEITDFLTEAGSATGAAVLAVRALAAMYARQADKWVGDLKILASQKHRNYLDLEKSLVARYSAFGYPSAGGIRVSDKESITENDDLVKPSFRRNLHDYEGL